MLSSRGRGWNVLLPSGKSLIPKPMLLHIARPGYPHTQGRDEDDDLTLERCQGEGLGAWLCPK